jgi:RNA polymerase sigma factor (sigma-70 family)
MLNGIRRLDPVSERVRRLVRIAERERYVLAVECGAMPTNAQLEQRHPSLARARTEAHRGTPLSLDAPLPPEAGGEPQAGDDPAATAVARAETRRIHDAIDALPPRQRTVILAHYFGERPLRALGDDLRVSPQRVSQLHILAIDRMRRTLARA